MLKQVTLFLMCLISLISVNLAQVPILNANEQIVFISDQELTDQIYLTNSVNSVSQITRNELADHSSVSCSPNEHEIAFSANYAGNAQIYSLNLLNGNLINVSETSTNDRFPAWSPDGSKIAFVSREGGNNLYIMNNDGSNRTQLTSDQNVVSNPAWSPNGNKIAFELNVSGESDIYNINVDGTDLVRLTNSPGFDGFPNWSPDSNKIAFVTARNGNFDIYVMNADGTNQLQLTEGYYSDTQPAWSPDGGRIAFSSNRDDGIGTNLYLMNADGSQISLLIDNLGNETSPCWLSASNVSIYSFTLVNADTDTDIRTLSTSSTETIDITNKNISIRADTDPAAVGSVVFTMDGIVVSTDNTASYTIAGENSSDILPWNIALGAHTHTVVATPYSDADGTGDAGVSLTVQVEIVDNH